MGDNQTLIVFLGFTIYLMGLFPVTYCSVFSNAFTPVKSQIMIHTAKNGQQEGNSPSAVTGWEEMEETFVASSTGEGMEVIDMVQPEDSETLSNAAVKDLLLDLALSLKIGSVVFFFLCMT
ncbi:LLLL and CFNLAS motif-containing protein 1-like [Manacus vitellinus]|uniref:LLLL and CFNLAS motif-containing protein 1-like n=1 Tax=Manacus vitellinus TaxID=328815 RepID=UPI00084766CA|nr:LLLL and CFNLAS motif-containing protein 1-like [Manacus vitellinus]